jgi:hypothetical protein
MKYEYDMPEFLSHVIFNVETALDAHGDAPDRNSEAFTRRFANETIMRLMHQVDLVFTASVLAETLVDKGSPLEPHERAVISALRAFVNHREKEAQP